MNKIKYIIFDCDGVLIDSEILANRVEVEVKTKLGFPITSKANFKIYGLWFDSSIGAGRAGEIAQRVFPDGRNSVQAGLDPQQLKPISGVCQTLEQVTLPKCVASSSEPESLDFKLNLTGSILLFAGGRFMEGWSQGQNQNRICLCN